MNTQRKRHDKVMFSERLKELRIREGLNQSQLAERFATEIGIPTPAITTLSSWETGSRMPTLETIMQLAYFFGVSLDYIAGYGESGVYNTGQKPIYYKEDYIIDISDHDLADFDGKPVYITFPTEGNSTVKARDRWGVYNHDDKSIYSITLKIRANYPGLTIYADTPESSPGNKPSTRRVINKATKSP